MICGKNGKQYQMSVSNLRRDNQNLPEGESCAGSSRMSNNFWAQYARARFAPLTSLMIRCFSSCLMARITVL
jgi:predicted PolB exonuclease-like 3'-5' exonuclease